MDIDLPHDHFDLSPMEVRDRFRLAHRKGSPLWLWPETNTQSWQEALNQIERVTGFILSGNKANIAFEGSADDFGIAAFTSGMGPLLGHWIKQGLLDANARVRSLLLLHHDHNRRRMASLTLQSIAAVEALAAAGVGVLVLKGMHTAHNYFPVPGARPVSDIDLLIDKSAEQTAAETLTSLGYLPEPAGVGERTWRLEGTPVLPKSLSLVHEDDPWSIDLHTSLDRKYSPGARTIRLDRTMEFRNVSQWPQSRGAHVLTGADLVHYLAVHASVGLKNLSLLRVTELVLVIRGLVDEDRLSWSRLVELAARTGSPGGAYPALLMANILEPFAVPTEVLETLERSVPAAVMRVLGSLTPATCQRILRNSLAERFMWTETPGGWLREVWGSLFPPVSYRELVSIYKLRAAYLFNGAIRR